MEVPPLQLQHADKCSAVQFQINSSLNMELMEQLNRNVKPETHNEDTRRADTNTPDLRIMTTHNSNLEFEIEVIKEEPDQDEFNFDEEHSELTNNAQIWARTLQSSDDVTTEQPAADIVYTETAPLQDTQPMDAVSVLPDHTFHDCLLTQNTLLRSDGVEKKKLAANIGYEEPSPVPPANKLINAIRLRMIGPCSGYVRLTTIMPPANPAGPQDCLHCCILERRQTKSFPLKKKLKSRGKRGKHLRVSSLENVYRKQVVPIELKTNNECVSDNSDCIKKVNGKKQANHTASRKMSYICDACQKCFSLKGNLQRHILTHTDYRPYKCKMCIKSYSTKTHLKRHNLSHTGDRPYKCDTCSKGFVDPSDLKRHIRTHTGEKPYVCNICNKRFNEQGNLKTHIRTHTGERPYKCKICDKRFTQYSSLHNHKQTSKKTYKCDLCKKTFCFPTYFKKHDCSGTKDKPYNFRSGKR